MAKITHFLKRNEKQNKTYAYDKEVKGSKEASLTYRIAGRSDSYYLLEIELHTGRHHQIRAQLAAIGCPVKGDLKYGFSRSNEDGGISLVAKRIEFMHPVKKENIVIVRPFLRVICGRYSIMNKEPSSKFVSTPQPPRGGFIRSSSSISPLFSLA